MRTVPTPRIRCFAVVVGIAVAGMSLPSWGQEDSSAPARPFHPLAFVVAPGGSNEASAEVTDLRVRIFAPILPLEDRSWGLRLRLTLYAGVYNLDLDGNVELDQIRFSSFGGTPGLEFLVPASGRWMLKPYGEIGYVRDFDNRLGFGVWGIGIRTVGTYSVRDFDLSLGSKLGFVSVVKSDLGLKDRFGELRLGFDANHPLGFTVGGRDADLSLYYIYRYFFNARIYREDGEPLTLDANHEVGFTFGTDPSIELWFIKLPRIGLGYRWGNNVRGIRLSFGFPF